MKVELSVLEIQLRQFQGVNENELISAMSLSQKVSDERVQCNKITDKTARVAMNYKRVASRVSDDWYDFLLKRYQSINEEVLFFEVCVDKYHVSHAMIGKYRKAAINEINIRYELRDKQTEEYLLS